MTSPVVVGKPPAHRRLTLSGIFGEVAAPFERWSMRWNLGVSESPGELGFIADAAVANLAYIGEGSKSAVKITEVKVAAIGANGLYTADPVIRAVYLAGSGTGGQVIPQLALAVSFGTQRRGPTGKGRVYQPIPGADVQADGVYSNAYVAECATRHAGFVNQLNAAAGFGVVVIASSKGYLTPVQTVKVGRVPDTIRSRRRQMTENYSATVATP